MFGVKPIIMVVNMAVHQWLCSLYTPFRSRHLFLISYVLWCFNLCELEI